MSCPCIEQGGCQDRFGSQTGENQEKGDNQGDSECHLVSAKLTRDDTPRRNGASTGLSAGAAF